MKLETWDCTSITKRSWTRVGSVRQLASGRLQSFQFASTNVSAKFLEEQIVANALPVPHEVACWRDLGCSRSSCSVSSGESRNILCTCQRHRAWRRCGRDAAWSSLVCPSATDLIDSGKCCGRQGQADVSSRADPCFQMCSRVREPFLSRCVFVKS